MKQHIYITGAEKASGKSALALAFMETLHGQGDSVGVFRPIQPKNGTPDPLSDLLMTRYHLAAGKNFVYGVPADKARELLAADRYDEILKRILEEFKRLEQQSDIVMCVGTDFSRAGAAFEFDFNVDVANNLGCVILPVVRGQGRSAGEIVDATVSFQESLESRRCDILAIVVNRVPNSELATVREQLARRNEHAHYVIGDDPTLARPTLADIQQQLNATLLWGTKEQLTREVHGYKVAAMMLPDFLDYIGEGDLIITPADRADIIVGSLLSYPSKVYPQIAGLLLTGGQMLAPQVAKLIAGLGQPDIAALSINSDTYQAAVGAEHVSAVIAADNERKVAAALGAVERSVDIPDLCQRLAATRSKRVTPLMFEHELIRKAKTQRKHIVLPEGEEDRILHAAEILRLREVVDITLLGDADTIRNRIAALGLHLQDINILDPLRAEQRHQFASTYFELRRHKGISEQMALDIMADVSYFGTMMVYLGQADGMVSGSIHTTQHTIRPAFEFIKTRPGAKLVSSVFFMCLADRVLAYADCAVNPNPNAEELADIAVTTADTAAMFGITPRIAMLSYSTGESGKGEDVDRVRKATLLARELRPDLKIEGPIQYDAAVDVSVAKTKLPNSEVAGQATVFIFPDLNTGNNTYKAVQRSAGAVAVGPILQGLNKPVNDLSRGCTVADIVNTVAITAIQAQTSGDSSKS